jgi:hypothetical protein
MGHPQVRWSTPVMTQDGGMPAQFQGDREGFEALPQNAMECGIFPLAATLLLAASLVMHSSRVATLQEIPQDADIYKQGDGRAAYDDRMSSVDIGQHGSV